jgi:hypothetical protein
MKSKHLLSLILFIFISLTIQAQDYSKLKEIDLSTPEKCKEAETKVIESCEYLFSVPCEENIESLSIIIFLIDWMGATPDYTFGHNDNFYKVIKSKEVIAGRYYAAMAMIAIQENLGANDDTFQLKAITKFLEYCENPISKMKINKKLKKYIDAKNNNSLKEIITSA